MHKSFLFFTLCLTACSFGDKPTQTKDDSYDKYLACYALQPAPKQECINALTFEAEKQGFKKFLNNFGKPCESITDSPAFIEDKQAYLVKCNPNYQYYMQFDYDKKQWNLIKDEE